MMHQYEIDTNNGVITQVFDGVITREIILGALDDLTTDSDFQTYYHIITDLRTAISDIPIQEIKTVAEATLSRLPSKGRKSAFIVDTPRNSAYALMFGQVLARNREFKIFSTMVAARKWVSYSEAKQKVV